MAANFYVYRNLHTGGFSIRHKGLVVARPERFILADPHFSISKPGQIRAREKKQRNVHAYIVGSGWAADALLDLRQAREIFYNPFTTDTFVDRETFEPIEDVEWAYFIEGKAYYV